MIGTTDVETQDARYRRLKAEELEDLEKTLKVLTAYGVTKYASNGLMLELQPESKLVTLDELMGEDKNQPPRPKTPYEQALERAAGVPEDENQSP